MKRIRVILSLSGVLLAVVAPLGIALGMQHLADTLGTRIGRNAAELLEGPQGSHEASMANTAPGVSDLASDFRPQALDVPSSAAEEASRKRSQSRAVRGSRRDKSDGGVRISAGQVLSLAEKRVLPTAVSVSAEGPRPSGLQLLGVSRLGVGMQDGDVLTRVAGVPVFSVNDVATVVLSARGRYVPEISAEFWREGSRRLLVVEQPYLEASGSTARVVQGAP